MQVYRLRKGNGRYDVGDDDFQVDVRHQASHTHTHTRTLVLFAPSSARPASVQASASSAAGFGGRCAAGVRRREHNA